MRDWRLSFWLIAGSIYALYSGLHWGAWQDLGYWTRVHVTIDVCAGMAMLLGGVILLAQRKPWRGLVLFAAASAALLGVSLIAGGWFGTIPCAGVT